MTRFVVPGIDDPALNGAPTITPDGSRLVYADVGDPNHSIYVRALDSLRSRMLPGTEGAVAPFVSPDGKWVGFFTGNKLKKVLLDGSALPVTLAAAAPLSRGSWTPTDIIVIGVQNAAALSWVSSAGGPLHELTIVDSAAGELAHTAPLALPDGKTVVFTVVGGANGGLAVVSIDPASSRPEPHVLLGMPGEAVGIRDGQLLVRAPLGTIDAVRYDATRHRLSGKPVPVLEDPDGSVGSVSLATDGTLLYDRSEAASVVLVDAHGMARPLIDPSSAAESRLGRMLMNPRLSPDGKRLELMVSAPGGMYVRSYDLASRTPTQVTPTGDVFGSEWAPDGRRLLYSTTDLKTSSVWLVDVDGRTPPEQLIELGGLVWSTLTPDGRNLVFQRMVNKVWSLWTMRIDRATRTPVPWLREPFNDYMPHVSPDGHWLTYVSGANEREEVFVRPFPGPGAPVQVSNDGGTEPMWAPDGHRLFYRRGRALIAASITTANGFTISSRAVLFQGDFDGGMPHANYAVARDGEHFVMITAGRVTTDAVVVRNWGREMAEKMTRRR